MRQAELNQIENVVEKFSLSNLRHILNAARNLSQHENVLDVAVVGRFKAGKTSVLNSLLDWDLLPTGVLPVTSVITRVSFGSEEAVFVHYENGTKTSVSRSEISSFISEKNNPNNQKLVEAIEIYTPKMARFKNLRFVDTPGIGSIFQHNTEVAKRWLPNIAGALVCIAPDPPMSNEELALLKEVADFTPEVNIVLTKADLVSPSERMEVRQFIARHTQGIKIRSIIEHSIKPEFKDMRANGLIAHIHNLSGDARSKNSEIFSEKLRLLSELAISNLRLSLASALTTEEVRTRLRYDLKSASERVRSFEDECRILERDFSARARSQIAKIFSELMPGLVENVRPIAEKVADESGSVSSRATNFEVSLNNELRKVLSVTSQNCVRQAVAPFHESARQVRERAEHLLNSLSQYALEAVGIELKQPPVELEPSVIKRPDIQISISVDASIAILGTIFPFLVSRAWVRRKFLKQISFEVEKNISRLTTQWHEISKDYLHRYCETVAAHLRASLATIESLIAPASGERIDELNETIEALTAAQLGAARKGN